MNLETQQDFESQPVALLSTMVRNWNRLRRAQFRSCSKHEPYCCQSASSRIRKPSFFLCYLYANLFQLLKLGVRKNAVSLRRSDLSGDTPEPVSRAVGLSNFCQFGRVLISKQMKRRPSHKFDFFRENLKLINPQNRVSYVAGHLMDPSSS